MQFGLRPLLDTLAADGQQVIERRGGGNGLHHGLSRGPDGGFAIELAEEEIFRMREPVMHRRIQLDHVLIAAEHERFLRLPLKTAGAMLHVPFVSGRFGTRRGGSGAEADLHDPHAGRLNARQSLDGPGHLIVDSRPAVRQDLLSEALDDARFVGPQYVDAVEDQESCGGIQRGAGEAPPVFDDAAELRGDIDGAKPVPDLRNG